jgi:hypothetical protein
MQRPLYLILLGIVIASHVTASVTSATPSIEELQREINGIQNRIFWIIIAIWALHMAQNMQFELFCRSILLVIFLIVMFILPASAKRILDA